MSWIPVSKLPVMIALREIKAQHYGPLFGPGRPRAPRQVGRQMGSTKKAMALLTRLDKEKNLPSQPRTTPGLRLARPELGLPIVIARRSEG